MLGRIAGKPDPCGWRKPFTKAKTSHSHFAACTGNKFDAFIGDGDLRRGVLKELSAVAYYCRRDVAVLRGAAYQCFDNGWQQMAATSCRLRAVLSSKQQSMRSERAAADKEGRRALVIAEGRLIRATS